MEVALDGVTVSIGGTHLVHELDLAVRTGEIVGLIGPNGSGKSTALRSIFRALRPTAGVVRVGGDDISRIPLRENARRVSALTQETHADFDFTVAEVVAMGRTPFKKGNEPLNADEWQMCAAAMSATDITHLSHRGVLELSGGERQRVLIARALVQQPEVLVLDEPTNHLDIRHQLAVLGRLREWGPTTLVVLHDLNLAAASCDRLAVLDRGRLIRVGTPAEVLTEGLIEQVFGVDATVVRHPLTGHPQVLFTFGESGMSDSVTPTPTEEGN